MVKRDSSLQRIRFHCSRVKRQQALLNFSRQLGLRMVILGLCAAARAMETHFTKLPKNSYCADVASRGSLELRSEFCNRGQTIFTHYAQHSAVLFCELVWPTTSRLSHCWPQMFHFTIAAQHLRLTGAALAEQKFDEFTFWKGGILGRCHAESHKFFSKANLLPMFVYGDCMAVCSISYTCQQRVCLKQPNPLI